MLVNPPPPDTLEQQFINVIAPAPREHVVLFDANIGVELPEELFSMMPSIETMPLRGDVVRRVPATRPGRTSRQQKTFPLASIAVSRDIDLDDNDWGHLIAHLTRQAMDGQIVSFEVLPRGGGCGISFESRLLQRMRTSSVYDMAIHAVCGSW